MFWAICLPRNSEVLAGYLSREGLTYKLLNAKPENAAREAAACLQIVDGARLLGVLGFFGPCRHFCSTKNRHLSQCCIMLESGFHRFPWPRHCKYELGTDLGYIA